jgi:photosynthetic reaction center cytochrome c subunit
MKLLSKLVAKPVIGPMSQFILFPTVVLMLLTSAAPLARAQLPAPVKPLLSDQAFKNVQILKGIPVDEFMATMGFFSSSLAENCLFCHVEESAGDWTKFALDNDNKKTARLMISMVNTINKNYFKGRRELTCYSCHRGGQKPKVTPSLADLYGPVPPDDTPDAMQAAAPKGPSPDQVLDRYLAAIGGAQKIAALASFTAKGIYQGFADERVPMEMYAKAPNQHMTVAHGGNGDTITTFDGALGWIAGPAPERPVQVFEMTGGDLDGAKLDGELFFPAHIKQDLTQWRSLLPTTIDDKDVLLIQGTMNGKYPIDLYFDEKTNLLLRSLRFADSPVGLTPTQVDYSDYRDVAGVKVPFKRVISWVDGRVIIELSEIQPNVNVDASKFNRPAPPVTKHAAAK